MGDALDRSVVAARVVAPAPGVVTGAFLVGDASVVTADFVAGDEGVPGGTFLAAGTFLAEALLAVEARLAVAVDGGAADALPALDAFLAAAFLAGARGAVAVPTPEAPRVAGASLHSPSLRPRSDRSTPAGSTRARVASHASTRGYMARKAPGETRESLAR
jgi:hypothetical protein